MASKQGSVDTLTSDPESSSQVSTGSSVTVPYSAAPQAAAGAKPARRIRKRLHVTSSIMAEPAGQPAPIPKAATKVDTDKDDDDFFNLASAYGEDDTPEILKLADIEAAEIKGGFAKKEEPKAEVKAEVRRSASPEKRKMASKSGSGAKSRSMGHTVNLAVLIENTLLDKGPVPELPIEVVVLDSDEEEEAGEVTPGLQPTPIEQEITPRRASKRRKAGSFDKPVELEETIIELIPYGGPEIPEVTMPEEITADISLELEEEVIDQELQYRINKRKAELEALQSFTVGVIIRTLLEGWEHVLPFVVTELSTQTFGAIRARYLEYLWTHFPPDTVGMQHHIMNECVLIWNNTRLYEFVTPQRVGVVPKSPSMLINAMLVQDFEKNREAEFQQRLAPVEPVDFDELVRNQIASLVSKQDADPGAGEEAPAAEEAGYFRISMRDKENVTIEVRVNNSTKIAKLAEYYRKHKKLDESATIKLVFDDEELSMEDTVEDTELEEDFTIDVHYTGQVCG